MKKLFLLLVMAIVAVTTTQAQNSLVVTLNHNDNISVFTGQNALVDAMAAADHGDLVTMGSGVFTATDITKAVKLRGTGMEEDPVSGAYRTRIDGGFNINITETTDEHLSMEGIYFANTMYTRNCDGATFNKCRFTYISTTSGSDYKNYNFTGARFTNCKITERINIPKTCSVSFINCVVCVPNAFGEFQGFMEFTNCYIYDNSGYSYVLANSTLYNCIIYRTRSDSKINSTCLCYNCISYPDVFANVNQATNTVLTQEEYDALFEADSYYVLTDEAKTTYLGNDGMEVGIYGGVLPWNTRILNPKITKCLVGKKTTEDGKLSVDIEVQAAE